MEPKADEVVLDLPEHFRVYKSGRVDLLHRPVFVPAGFDDASGVASKDVVLDATTGLSVRLFLPKLELLGPSSSSKKLPILVYFHGGGFIVESAKSTAYHNYVTSLASAAGVLAVSVDYRLAPAHPLPAAYDDCWAALRWAASAQDGWLAEHGDASRVFVAGDSAGGNIVHNMLVRASSTDDAPTPRIEGAVLLHPYFGGSTAMEGEVEGAAAVIAMLWAFACPGAADGADDPRFNPIAPGAGSHRLRAGAGVRGGEGLAGDEGPRVLRGRGGQRLARGRGVARVQGGGARLLPAQGRGRVRERQAADGPSRCLHRRGLTCSVLRLRVSIYSLAARDGAVMYCAVLAFTTTRQEFAGVEYSVYCKLQSIYIIDKGFKLILS
ncbi:hypothetical protein BS78_02G206400 [Paspalum vaginatum]|nr:hypothetical protein BS78_02G206400 [Paspalum vaginatum]